MKKIYFKNKKTPFFYTLKGLSNKQVMNVFFFRLYVILLCVFYFSYLNKFTEFLRLFVSIHLRRFENSSHFPVLELLTLLYKYTFKQVNT